MTEPLHWRDLVERQNDGRVLSQRWLDWFSARGVPATVLAFSPAGEIDMLLQDCVEWRKDGATFEFSGAGGTSCGFPSAPQDFQPPRGDRALTFLVRDRYGLVQDVVAWCPRTDRLATWTGRACMIGADQLDAMQPDAAGLMVCESVLQWLQARRMAVVILDYRRALPLLLDRPLLASNLEHGRSLRGALRRLLPPVLVPETAVSESEMA